MNSLCIFLFFSEPLLSLSLFEENLHFDKICPLNNVISTRKKGGEEFFSSYQDMYKDMYEKVQLDQSSTGCYSCLAIKQKHTFLRAYWRMGFKRAVADARTDLRDVYY